MALDTYTQYNEDESIESASSNAAYDSFCDADVGNRNGQIDSELDEEPNDYYYGSGVDDELSELFF